MEKNMDMVYLYSDSGDCVGILRSVKFDLGNFEITIKFQTDFTKPSNIYWVYDGIGNHHRYKKESNAQKRFFSIIGENICGGSELIKQEITYQ